MGAPSDTTQKADIRDYLAAKRTLLAWIRTGLALMGFGFVVARFGLFPAGASGRRAFFGAADLRIITVVRHRVNCRGSTGERIWRDGTTATWFANSIAEVSRRHTRSRWLLRWPCFWQSWDWR